MPINVFIYACPSTTADAAAPAAGTAVAAAAAAAASLLLLLLLLLPLLPLLLLPPLPPPPPLLLLMLRPFFTDPDVGIAMLSIVDFDRVRTVRKRVEVERRKRTKKQRWTRMRTVFMSSDSEIQKVAQR